ncbi:chromate efflux transporter [Chengkuizengella sp. 2205SS18-9]|uniref:Chromate efflux transporter n=2 Tax=Chengkuizengella axinellae TaxID=3064388 RepID=A0ABT9IYB6_9BACL|nr:chromate efflux transporter [Chengkuizengella sp. 2205SS18-9]MDP5274310.1 chromate efflux transporter [Chengkuizengella sp. 2205SS18-9]
MSVKEMNNQEQGSIFEVFWTAFKLGLTSFGGPIAHLGYFREAYVKRLKWLDEKTYVDLVALCQFLPGPASSQVGIGIGLLRAGVLGSIAAWIGFTMPSVIALIVFAYAVGGFDIANQGWLHGLKLVAVAIVAQAVWGMMKAHAPDRTRGTIAIVATIFALLFSYVFTQVMIIILAGIFGWFFLSKSVQTQTTNIKIPIRRFTAVTSLVIFAALLVLLPILTVVYPTFLLSLFDSFYRVGSLVFGGGHVVLPLLESEVVNPGWVTNDQFIAGYGATQAVPGPLFTFSAYLGAVMDTGTHAVIVALVAVIAIFLPSFLLVIGTMPFWNVIRQKKHFQSALMGINAAVVGILLAALYDPVWTSSVNNMYDFVLVIITFSLLMLWKLPPWMVVVVSAIGGSIIGWLI